MSPSREVSLPIRADYGRGTYRRRIRLDSSDDEIRGELADDFHHFGVRLRHDGQRVVAVVGEDVRVPWTTCPGAISAAQQLVGLPLRLSLLDVARHANLRSQCTHLFDLASLAVAHAARVVAGLDTSRQYDAALADPSSEHPNGASADLLRDGARVLDWTVDRMVVREANDPALEGLKLSSHTFYRFVESELDPEAAEAALVLRRAVFIGLGRRYDFDRISRAAEFAEVVGSACHTFAPERVDEARRVVGTIRDFSAGTEGIFDRDRPRTVDRE